MKNDVIDHFVTGTSLEWQVIEIAWQNTDIARIADPRRVLNCQSFCYGFCHLAFRFGVTSHPLTKHVFSLSLYCSESMRCFFQRLF